jgi:hypothetical protein
MSATPLSSPVRSMGEVDRMDISPCETEGALGVRGINARRDGPLHRFAGPLPHAPRGGGKERMRLPRESVR